MRIAVLTLQWAIRLLAVVLVVLGVLFWTGNAFQLIPVHMLLGFLLVLALWGLAIVGAIARVPVGIVVAAVVWGVVVIWLGVNQDSLLPGDLHWIIRILHLLVGVAAVGLAESLAARIRRSQPAASS